MNTINHTGRHKIKRRDVKIAVRGGDTVDVPLVFDLRALDLSHLDLPESAEVWVEAFHQYSFASFAAGTVSDVKLLHDQPLESFSGPESVRFRVKITDSSGSGMILAVSVDLRPSLPGGGVGSLLTIQPDEGMREELWQLVTDEESTTLRINSKVENWRMWSKSPEFRALVLPAVFRNVLQWLGGAMDGHEPPQSETESNAVAGWFWFLKKELPGLEARQLLEEDESKRKDYENDAVALFCRSHKFFEKWKETEQGSQYAQ